MATSRPYLRVLLALAAVAVQSSATADECLLCETGSTAASATEPMPELRVEVIDPLRFARVALAGQQGGEVMLSPDGTRTVSGEVADIGGAAMAGRIRIVGAPYRPIRVELPAVIRLTAGSGRLEIQDVRSSLPPQPRLDANGILEFGVGGTLMLRDAAASGQYRASFTLKVEYE